MRLKNSVLRNEVVEMCELPFGSFFFCEYIIIAEINEGVHFDYDLVKVYIQNIKAFYGNKPIGFVFNRLYDISVNALDYSKFNTVIPNLCFYSVVRYNNINSFNGTIEERFCSLPYKSFNSLIDSYDYVNNYIINKLIKIA